MNFQIGLTKEQIEEAKNSLLPTFVTSEVFAELILEQDLYSLALQLGLKNKFSIAKAYLFLGDLKKYEDLMSSDISSDDSNLCLAIRLKMNGEALRALKLLEALPVTCNQYGIEVLLQCGSASLYSSDYRKAFNYYKKAYELAEELGYTGKQAIAAFNSAVAASYLHLDLESRTWLWYAENILKNYYLPTLQRSVDLFKIENNLYRGNFIEVVSLAKTFLQNANLNLVQQVISLQSLAKALLELGYVIESESVSSQARHCIQKNRFYQYEIYQLALETNIEVVTHRRVAREKSVNSPNQTADEVAQRDWKIACARKSILAGDVAKALKTYQDFQNETPIVKIEDLAVLAGEVPLQKIKTARGAEAYLLRLLQDKKWNLLRTFIEVFSVFNENNAWVKILVTFAEVFFLMSVKRDVEALSKLELVIQTSEDVGLERLTTIAVGLSALLSPKRQIDWMERVNSLDPYDKQWFADFFNKTIGRDLVSGKWIVFQNQKKLMPDIVEEMHSAKGADLVINQEKGSVNFQGQSLPISGQSVLFQIVVKLAQSQKQGLNKEELVNSVWGYEYDPSVHDAVIYTSIARLRELFPIELYQGRYRISTNIDWCLISDEKQNQIGLDLTPRQLEILKIFKNKNVISRRDLVKTLNISERTALRELTDLTVLGLISKQGQGRSVCYLLTEKSEAAI